MTTNTTPSSSTDVTVRLVGGPAYWDGQTLTYPRADVHEGPLDDVGAYLLIPDSSHLDAGNLPPWMGVDPRAHYAPDSEATREVWTFQGWIPA
ncbi:hypothetical protein ACIRPH_31560 [Nocardiopsis sp. NPDC101807]|uniref:hypothetical protein n=1 Tax=Nocardiopsis sp. NPDC101807 TaxID=3364339 RepID=UPI0038167F64